MPSLESLVGVVIAHASHGLSVIALYHMARAVFPGPSGRQLAFMAGCLHIISPAGVFLSAPYGESTFALLSFVGFLFFVWSIPISKRPSIAHDLSLVLSGLALGAATTVRNNGLLSGLLFLEEAVLVGLSLRDGVSVLKIRRLALTGLGGVCVGFGFLLPQYIAYQEYCGLNSMPRAWCAKLAPSIYTFVQEYYWYVPKTPKEFLLKFYVLTVMKGCWLFEVLEVLQCTPFPSGGTSTCHFICFWVADNGLNPTADHKGNI